MTEEGVLEIIRRYRQISGDPRKTGESLYEEFYNKKDWGLFLQRWATFDWKDNNVQELNCEGAIYFHFSTKEEKDYVYITAYDTFRGETNDYTTRDIPIRYFIEYLVDDEYMNKLFRRLESLKKVWKKKKEEEREKLEYQEYLRLKKKYEGV